MPTPPPEPMSKTTDKTEQLKRAGAVAHIVAICEQIKGFAYGTRSHMPGGFDFTDFTDKVDCIIKFAKARPDWMVEVVEYALDKYGPDHSAAAELKRLREVIETFEIQSGLKLEEYPYRNEQLAKAVATVREAGGPKDFMAKIRETLRMAALDARHMADRIDGLVGKEER